MAKGQIKQKQEKIDVKQFEQLCKMQCTEKEICAWFDVCEDTLVEWCKNEYGMNFSDVYEQKKEGGKIALRRYQLQQAEKNPTMAIWLGKQYLKQRDNIEVESKQLIKVEELLNKIEEEANK